MGDEKRKVLMMTSRIWLLMIVLVFETKGRED